MINYVVGFLFSPDGKEVVLIRKNRPAFMVGKLNGLGGKIEDTDPDSFAAMEREFREETGLTVDDWYLYKWREFPEYQIYYFYAFGPNYKDVRTVEDEEVGVYSIETLDRNELYDGVDELILQASDHVWHYWYEANKEKLHESD